MEIWKKLDGVLGEIYEVSNFGRVRSIDTVDSWGEITQRQNIKIWAR